MNFNTLKTVHGCIFSLAERIMPVPLSRNSISSIYNYVRIDDRLSTSGQPTEAQFKSIRAAGFEQVINLAPHSADNALPDEAGCLAHLGLPYLHIPVDFNNPSSADFERFVQAMDDYAGKKLWVHCAANMRVSAFIYRYRRLILGASATTAKADLEKIWEPYGVWRNFIKIEPGQLPDRSR